MQTIAPALTNTIAGAILNGLKKGIIMNTEELKRLAEARRQQEQAERARREGLESLLLSWNVEAKEAA